MKRLDPPKKSELTKSPDDEKSGKNKRKSMNGEVPKITLDDLRDPAAFEAMVNNVASKIAEEKKKVKVVKEKKGKKNSREDDRKVNYKV